MAQADFRDVVSHTVTGGVCQFSALQPLLAFTHSPQEIQGLLALSILFWQRPSFTDTQIADNPHLYRAYVGSDAAGLAELVKALVRAGESRLLLRAQFVVSPGSAPVECRTLSDVYRAWLAQALPEAWVVPPTVPNRQRFVDYWEKLIPPEQFVSYDYVSVKTRFQRSVRTRTDWDVLTADVGPTVGEQLKSIAASDWFSHSQLFAALRSGNRVESDAVQFFGVLDEAAYSEELRTGLAYHGLPRSSELDMSPERKEATAHSRHLIERAFGQIQSVDLTMLGSLGLDELLRIREEGRFLIDQVQLLDSRSVLSDDDLRSLGLSLNEYWNVVCRGLQRFHPGVTTTRTWVGLRVDPVGGLVAASDGISVVLSGLFTLLTGTKTEGQTGIVRKLIDSLSLRFLFRAESEDMKRLRQVFSRSTVLAAPSVLRLR